MSVFAAVLAAGKGERFGSDKALLPLRGKPVWKWSYDVLDAHPEVTGIAVVCSEANAEQIQAVAPEAVLVRGGDTRQGSSRAALQAAPGDTEIILLQDAARPFITSQMVSDVIAATRRAGASAPGIPVVDTIKQKLENGLQTLDRAALYAMQTPQGARTGLLRRAYASTPDVHSDDLAVLEAAGVTPEVVPGDVDNFKITTPQDYERARSLLGVDTVRTGIGYDVHAFSTEPGRPLVLGGVIFPDHPGLSGHSDADALLHAVVDALLGAAALGDIGEHFPPSDPQWKDRSSTEFLRFAGDLLNQNGWRILNIDATVIAESPKIMSRAGDIRMAISQELHLTADKISVKATTNERMGFIGRGEGIAAFAIATIAGA
jgi:2-C-methyl-D-erythritol 4-phosphate cytidylyltransferase / 2-C-methyl-D-erythritol 2,4-cyclodiphosphate synthase